MKAEVQREPYPFIPKPSLDEERLDLHPGEVFKIRKFRVTREGNYSWLDSPDYEQGDSTLIDWVPPDEGDQDR